MVILGEQHHRPESTALAGAVAAAFTGEGRCLVVGLEVAFTEQGPVDAVLDGTTTVSAVKVHPIVDHVGFRGLLARLREMRGARRCVSALAIDAPPGKKDRDRWMADAVSAAAVRGPVLVLVGRIHSLKRVR